VSKGDDVFGASVEVDLEPLLAMGKGLRVGLIKAGNRAARPIREAMIAMTAKGQRYGFLSKAIGTKTKVYGGNKLVTVVGPKMSFTRTKGKYSRGQRKGQPRRKIPYLYALLLNKGTKRSRGRNYLERILAAKAGEYGAIFSQEVGVELAVHAAKGD
jgi:hypothetical protein